MARKIDSLGRLVIPKDIRKSLSLDTGSEVSFNIKDGLIIIAPLHMTCKICGLVGNVKGTVGICEGCLSKIKTL